MTTHLTLSLEGRDPAAAIDALMRSRQESGRRWWKRPVHVWLSGALARPFLFGPVSGLKGWREACAAAAALAPAACGLSGPCEVFLETDPADGPVLATAVEQSLLDALHAHARVARLRVASIRPVWARAVDDAAFEKEQALLLCGRDADALTVLAFRGKQVTFAATYAPAPDAANSLLLLRRLRASTGLGVDQVLAAEVRASLAQGLPEVRWLNESSGEVAA
jgi:hypothetical protein